MTLTAPDTLRYNTAPERHPHRWGLRRGGIVNVWFYRDVEFDLGGGRMILRGTNGAGKSRALEMLLPFLLDADRQRMDATGSGRVTLDDLMRTGAEDASNRLGYLWLELERTDPAGATSHLTLGAAVRYSTSTRRCDVRYFTTPLRVGHELHLLGADRQPLNRESLTDLVGAERVHTSPEDHRDVVRTEVFGLRGEAGKERFANLVQLLHTLRAPDVGNRIDEGRLPKILSDALAPLEQASIDDAGEQLDGLTETRSALDRLENAAGHVHRFLDVYRRYAADVVVERAGQVLEAVRNRRAADRAAREATDRLTDLTARRAAAMERESELDDEHKALERSLAALRSRDLYKQADDLAQRDRAVAALASATDAAIAAATAARATEDRDLEAVDVAAASAVDAGSEAEGVRAELATACEAATVSVGGLPTRISAAVVPGAETTTTVRLTRDQDRVAAVRRAAPDVQLEPSDLDALVAVADAVSVAVVERHDLAGRRLVEARRLEQSRRDVDRADDEAGRADAAATALAVAADSAADDAAARTGEFVTAWRAHLTAAPAWPVAIDLTTQPLLAAAVDGSDLDDDELVVLDRSAGELVRPLRQELSGRQRDLDAADAADAAIRADLEHETAELHRERDPVPANPPWLAPDRAGPPLWRCLDFAPDVPDADQAGLEAALLASGLLTATVTPDGAVRAVDGEVLLSPVAGSGVGLSQVLRADPDGPVEASVVASVLAGITLAGSSGGERDTVVGTDGSWRHGGLRGRHVVDAAVHIGATARARGRERRLAAIEAELADLARTAAQRAETRIELDRAGTAVDGWERGAPTSRAVALARLRAADAVIAAERGRDHARERGRVAADLRARWTGELGQHRELCRHHVLPSAAPDLESVVGAADHARAAAREFGSALRRFAGARNRHAVLVERCAVAAIERAAADDAADRRWRSWYGAHAEVEALHATLDVEIAGLQDEISRTETARDRNEEQRESLRRDLPTLHGDHSRAEADRDAAVERATRELTTERRMMQQLTGLTGLPGLVSAAGAENAGWTGDDVAGLARQLVDTVNRRGAAAGVQAVVRAYETFGREVSGQFETEVTVEDDVYLVTVHGAGDERTLAGVHTELSRRLAESRTMLTERERTVFTRFVLGRVAEQLRVRIEQAETLVGAMNASLARVRTSHGIGVTLHWRLADDAGDDIRRIKALVARAGAVRSDAENDELTELLRARVEAEHAIDASAGYAAHLAAALDYRAWHTIVVTITGPGDQTRQLSRRAKLSQGETRFVSYVALFAAADGYLSSLPEGDTALRLVLLDDAFAKVDDPTVAELMGLLVRLDLDFVLTGHALWGCYPVVPSIDVYEVRRLEGGSAVTSHVHWDGHTRHLRPS
jgi:uncharacterized protein (TIGR02680 family)